MPRRHALARKKIIILHTVAERKRLRHFQRKSGPAALRRRERREHLQLKPPQIIPDFTPIKDEVPS